MHLSAGEDLHWLTQLSIVADKTFLRDALEYARLGAPRDRQE